MSVNVKRTKVESIHLPFLSGDAFKSFSAIILDLQLGLGWHYIIHIKDKKQIFWGLEFLRLLSMSLELVVHLQTWDLKSADFRKEETKRLYHLFLTCFLQRWHKRHKHTEEPLGFAISRADCEQLPFLTSDHWNISDVLKPWFPNLRIIICSHCIFCWNNFQCKWSNISGPNVSC